MSQGVTFDHHDGGYVRCARWDRKSDLVVATGTSKMVKVWNKKTGELLHAWKNTHQSEIDACDVSGTTVVSADFASTVCIWDSQKGDLQKKVRLNETTQAWSIHLFPASLNWICPQGSQVYFPLLFDGFVVNIF